MKEGCEYSALHIVGFWEIDTVAQAVPRQKCKWRAEVLLAFTGMADLVLFLSFRLEKSNLKGSVAHMLSTSDCFDRMVW